MNYQPAVNEHLTPKIYVDNAIDEITVVIIDQDNDFNNPNLTNVNSITLNTQAGIDNNVILKTYVDQFHSDNEGNRKYLGRDFYDESNDLLKKIKKLISMIIS